MTNKKASFKKILKGAILLFGSIVTFYIVVFAFIFLRPFVGDYASRTRFDSNAWKAAKSWTAVESSGANPLRTQMVNDLLSNYHLVGKTRSEIDVILGAPSEPPFRDLRAPSRDSEYYYWLGLGRGGFGIDSEWLIIEFKSDVVTETRIYR